MSRGIARLARAGDPRLVLLWVALLGYIAWPALRILLGSIWEPGRGLTGQPWRAFLASGHLVYLGRSLWISLATVVLAGLVGTFFAIVYHRLDFPGRGLLAALTLLPFTLPPLVGVFSIWMLMGEMGPLEAISRRLLGRGLGFERGYGGVLLVHTYSMFVYFYVMVGGALAALDESQIDAARDLGAGRAEVWRRVVLPQLAPALAGASLLTFMTSMASYTAPLFYIPGQPVLTLGIQQALERGESALASTDCVVLIACAMLFLILITRHERQFSGASRGAARRPRPLGSPAIRGVLSVVMGVVTLGLLAPHLMLIRESLVRPGTGFIGVPVAYGLQNYARLMTDPEMWRPITNSLSAAMLATLACGMFGLCSAWAVWRRRPPMRRLLTGLVMLPWALPGTVVAVGLLWVTRQPGWLTGGQAIRNTVWILGLAYFIRLLPLAHRTIAAGYGRVPLELELAARDLGAPPLAVFGRITLPLLLPALIAAMTLVFATSMGEFVSSILLYGPASEPISVQIEQLRRGPGGVHLASAYSVLLMGMITATYITFGRFYRGRA